MDETEHAVRAIPKETIASLCKSDADRQELIGWVYKQVGCELTEKLYHKITNGDEYICKLSPATMDENIELNAMQIKQEISFAKLIRCANCSNWDKTWANMEGMRFCTNFSQYTGPEFFCADGEEKKDV